SSTITGLERGVPPLSYFHAISNCLTLFLVICLRDEYCEESEPPKFESQVAKLGASAANTMTASAAATTHNMRLRMENPPVPGSSKCNGASDFGASIQQSLVGAYFLEQRVVTLGRAVSRQARSRLVLASNKPPAARPAA